MLNLIKTVMIGFVLLANGSLFAQSAASDLSITDSYVREMIPGQQVTAAYFTLHNPTKQTYVLSGVKSSVAGKVEIHQTFKKDNMMRMEMLPKLVIKPQQTVKLEPGGLHIMLLDVKKPLLPGETVPLHLTFEDGSEVALNVLVKTL